MLIPDLTMYMNIWLCLAAFFSKQENCDKMDHAGPEFKVIILDLIKIFNENPLWKATDINLCEAINISVAIAVLKVGNE